MYEARMAYVELKYTMTPQHREEVETVISILEQEEQKKNQTTDTEEK